MAKVKPNKKMKLIAPIGVSLALIAALLWYVADKNIMVFNPHGTIAKEQYDLIVFTLMLSLVIVLPVFALTFYIVWKYRASNTKAKYSPDMDGSRAAEAIWWIIPLILITILSVVIWRSSHDLDPYKPLDSDKKPLTVQVVALQWRWLFIYPEHNRATVNDLVIPEDRPINFQITSDAPMNSFWIPQLGGQVYAMSGMSTKLHLMADRPGEYQGVSANLSGEGFADMKFAVRSVTTKDFDHWLASAPPDNLDQAVYDLLAKPTHDTKKYSYTVTDTGLYNKVVAKYMDHRAGDNTSEEKMEHGH